MKSFIHLITPISPAEFTEMGIHPVTLSFRGKRERNFLDEYTRQSVTHVRFAFVMGIILYSLFALLDLRVAPEFVRHLFLIRFGFILPVTLLLLALTFVSSVRRYLHWIVMVWIFAGGAGIIEMIRVIPPDAANDYYAGLILVFMFASAFGRIRFIWAGISILSLLALFEATVLLLTDIPLAAHINNNFFLFSAALISLVICYTLELFDRRGYYLNCLVAIEHQNTAAANRALEAKIQKRTEELIKANEEIHREMEVRRISVEALLESEEKYRTLFETFLVPIILTGPKLHITDINQAGRRLFGYEGESLIGGPLERLFYDRLDCTRLRNELKSADEVRNFNVAMVTAEGNRVECMLSTAVRHDDEGNILHYQVFINDITEHRRLERQFFQSQKMESVGRLAGGIAHDFNNLLTVIIGNADIIELLAIGNDKIEEHIREIKHTSERAAKLTRQLLTFSRHQVFEPRVTNANDILLEMDHMLRRLIGEDVELVTLLEESLWQVKIDPGQIEQVLTNIVVNARDAMPEGGKVTIETANVTLDDEFVAKHHELTPGDYIMIAVTDSGMGMSKETACRIFEPFFTTKEKGKGTGLGLSTCYGIVRQHDGHIMVHSRQDHGSTFIIYLPRTTGAPESAQPKAVSNSLPVGTETILIAEDEPAVRDMITRALEEAGYKVLEAFNGEEALQKGAAYGFANIDLLITDMVMPKMGGRELSERVSKERPGIRILFISGYTNDSIIRRRIQEKQFAFLHKPFTPASIVFKVRELLDEPVVETPDEHVS